jgi:tetratricopeptide (TPR) repeat protein
MIRAETMNIIEDRKASICAAECFIRMRDYDLALKALVPLKENPASLQERQKMSLAGEIFLRKNMPEKAEPFLETALAGLNGKYLESLWGASTLANLGKAYAMNRKITKALNVFKKAQAAFALNKKNSEAGKCAKISGALRNIIESYKNAIR